jgi:hypothetical protein
MKDSLAKARKLVSPRAFAEGGDSSWLRTIVVPVPDDRWAPAMMRGEFAVVDVSNVSPEHDAFIVRRSGSAKNMAIVRLRLWDESGPMKIVRAPGEELGVHWAILYGAQRAMKFDGTSVDDEDLLAHFHMCDGPLPDRFMRDEIVGRIVGVMSHDDPTMNWRHWIDR